MSTPKSTYPWYHLLSIKKKVNGYPTIGIWYMGKRKFWGLHRWVLFAFKGPSKDGRIGMHKDGNKENNKLSNLKYATYAENNEDRFKKYPDLGFRCTAHLHK